MRYIVNLAAAIFLCVFVAAFPVVSSAASDDIFIKGYVSAVLEREFHLTSASPEVLGGVIVLKSEEVVNADRDKLINVLSGIRGVKGVEILGDAHQRSGEVYSSAAHKAKETDKVESYKADTSKINAKAPDNDRLFAPLIADPRWPHFSIAYHRYLDDGEFRSIAAVSFGETLPVYKGSTPNGGLYDVGIQAAVFAYFDLDTPSWDLLNEDYNVAIPVAYRKEAFSALFRLFHNSSHLGDELLLHSKIKRLNYSYQSVDLKLSYDIRDWFRVYGGGEYDFSRTPKDLKPWATQYGLEYKSPRKYFSGIVRPVAGADFRNRQENNWHSEISVNAGVSIENAVKTPHIFQIMLGYYNGNSPNGQFRDQLIEFISLGGHYYF